MKKLFIIVLLATMVSCGTFIKNTYVALSISKTSFNQAMTSVADLQKQNLITPAQREEINKYAKIFKEAHNTLVDALEVYATTNLTIDKEKVVVAMTLAASKWAQFADLINAIKPGTIKPYGR